MMSVELRTPEPGNGFGGAAADLSLAEQLAAGPPGAAEAKPRSFGDELDDSLLESETEHEPPACTTCPAAPLPLVGVLRAFGPLIELSGPAGKAVEEVTPASPTHAGAAEPIPADSSVSAPADAGVASDAPEMNVAFVTQPGVDAGGQPPRRDDVSHEQVPPETPRAVTGAIDGKRSSEVQRQSGPLPGLAQDSPETITAPAQNRIEAGSAEASEHRFVAGERRPMTARPGATDLADSGPGAGIGASASKHSTDASATPRPSADLGDDSRRQPAAHRSPTEFAAVEGRTGAATPETPERAIAGREQSWQPLSQAEPAPAFESSPRAAVEAGFRMVSVGPSPPAPQVTVTQPVAENVEAPRVPVAPDTADSIVQSMRLQYQRGGGDAVVQIKPEHLGPVSISLRVENGAVSAVVHAESGEVAEWLKSNEQLLREGLASSGLHLERFAVRRDGHPPDRRGWRPPEPPERRRRGLQPESTFEISV